ncbi:hypothetical protein O5D80_006612 [Batrachochytrium dendrobatidis]|nr:hypothetical protein O5D80_006612 [Batrachochytrium dendrobatidis]
MTFATKTKKGCIKRLSRCAALVVAGYLIIMVSMHYSIMPTLFQSNSTLTQTPPQTLNFQITTDAHTALLSSDTATTSNSKLILVGILTSVEKLQRRTLIRDTYARLKPANVDLVFVFGRPKDSSYEALIRLESIRYGDIMVVDCKENMDDGKTFAFFKHVGSVYPPEQYGFVMKADDDCWIGLDNLAKWVSTMPQTGTYFGRHVSGTGFMAGMGYGLSFDLVQWIATDAYPSQHRIGQEDSLLASWLRHSNQLKHYIGDETKAFYDDPAHARGWAHPYTANTILIHRLKNEAWFLKAAEHFLPAEFFPNVPNLNQ